MANDNNNLPDQSSMVRPMFTMAPLAHRELLLVGRRDLKWKDPSFDVWLKDVELNIHLKKYSEESDKIAQLKSQLETECGEVPDMINANANFFCSIYLSRVDRLTKNLFESSTNNFHFGCFRFYCERKIFVPINRSANPPN